MELTVYHGSNKLFKKFSKEFVASRMFNAYGKGFYFTKSLADAKGYGKYVYKCKISINNTYQANHGEEGAVNSEELIKQGYDSVNYLNIYVVFQPENIKILEIKEYNAFRQLLKTININDLNEDFNDNFWKWFGNSKVIDKKGNPLIVYHGSPKNDIEIFDVSRGLNINGIYFSDNLNVAAHWSSNSSMKRKKNIPNADTVEELLQILNIYTKATIEYVDFEDGRFYRLETYDGDVSSPLGYKKDETTYILRGKEYDLRDRLKEEINSFADYSEKSGTYGCYLSIQKPLIVNANKKPYYRIDFNGDIVSTEQLAIYAQENGYDGVIVKNLYETDYENILCNDYIVFNSNQIKSIDNNGDWSKNSNNIYENKNANILNISKDVKHILSESNDFDNNFIPELNDNFKWWFRDSKVVDENGQPLVCYHGSTVDIEEFDLGYSGNTTGNNQEEVFYFTSDKDTAITYSQEATVRENEWRFYDEETGFDSWDDYAEHLRNEVFDNPHINPCYLRIENPYVFDANYTEFDYKRNYTLCSLLKGNSNIDYDMWDEGLAEELYDVFTEYDEENDEYIEKNVSFDGIIIKNVVDNISEDANYYIDVYIVWDSRQIKSVFNKGIWDLNNPNVNEEFNTKTTGMGYYDDILNDPKYSEKKRKFGKTIKISPKTYIEACVEGFNTNANLGEVAERTTFEKLIKSRRDKKLEEIKANFYKIDYDMPILHYEYRNDEYISFGQEGLHRAIAAMDLGEKEIPVLLTVSLEYKADDGIEDADLKMFLNHMVERLTKGGKMDEKLKKTIIKPKNMVLDDMEDETGMNTIAEEGASFAQLGTAPTPTAGQPTINGKPVQGKSVKKSKEKSKVSKLIEQFQKLI